MMSDASTAPAPLAARRARPYLRVLWIIPALALLGAGLYYQLNVDDGGEVSAIKLTTKTGMVGQAAEAVANIDPGTPDLYLKLTTPLGETSLQRFTNTPIGNGLTWNLSKPLPLEHVSRIDVWDHHSILKDKQLDRITPAGWSTDGQRFHIDLLGVHHEPPRWALPVAAIGGALTLLVVIRFVWDQAI